MQNTMVPLAPLAAGMEPYPGWRLTQFIGRGGFSEVWKVEVADSAPLAVKFVPTDERGAASREVRSLQMVRKLEHPNLVRIERVWIYFSYIAIAMELADGSMLDLLEAYQAELRTPLPPEMICMYLRQAADVLDFLNTRQHVVNGQRIAIQHCDVKPSNMLLCGDTLKLTDFGLSSATTGHVSFHRRAGTTMYAAPEVFQGKLSDRTDQYALAVSYCELRGGYSPFHDPPAYFEPGYVPPAPDLSMLSSKERPIIARALHPIPPNRWPSCTEMLSRLMALVT